MKPIGQYILVKPYPSDEMSEAGILIPESARKPSNKVLVVEVGNGSKKKPMKLNKGQTGFRVQGWGEEIIIDGEKHYLMTQDSILAGQ